MISVAQLVKVRSRKRRLSRAALKALAPREPRAIEMEYMRDLIAHVRKLAALVRTYLYPVLSDIARTDERADAALWVGRMPERLKIITDETVRLSSARQLELLTDKTGAKVAKHTAKEVKRLIPISVENIPQIAPLLDGFRQRNIGLIQDLGRGMVSRVERVLQEATREGMRAEAIEEAIEHALGVTESRAALIARDQVLKLNGQMQQARQVAVGIKSYGWLTAGDGNVRDDHKVLDGKTFDWATGAVINQATGERGHPGDAVQCRCQAIPILPEED